MYGKHMGLKEASPKSPTRDHEKPTESLTCCVCGGESDGAHWCLVCHKPVHAICGDHDLGQEGFGQPLTCRKCIDLSFGAKAASVSL